MPRRHYKVSGNDVVTADIPGRRVIDLSTRQQDAWLGPWQMIKAVWKLRVIRNTPDLRQALTQLASRAGARVVRVDSGGQLTRALLDLRLVGEISLVVHSCLTDAGSHRW
jgi:riboflavin biosynthesis pyrimidine reductase